MDSADRPHSFRSGGPGSELFICFTPRPSASSSFKSLLSPCRGRDPSSSSAPSLSATLSRRLRSSVKGSQSPMFTAVVAAAGTGGRRKGCAFEAAEPSSPKVTCIGQVRVKTGKRKAKKGAALRSRSRRAVGGEPSFRRTGKSECFPSKSHGWVCQIPGSICGAVKSFGSELNCFLPCGGRSSFCFSSRPTAEKEKAGELARWLMTIQKSEEGKHRGLSGLVVEKGGKGEMGLLVRQWQEKEVEVEEKDNVLVVGDEEEGRVSVCIPPPNALLLMRCRSDPVRMAELANRFWGSPVAKVQVEEEDEENEQQEEEEDDQCHAAVVAEEHGEVGAREMSKGVVAVTEELDLKDSEAEANPQGVASAIAAEEMGDLAEEKEPTLEKNQEQLNPFGHKQDVGEEAQIVLKYAISDDLTAGAEEFGETQLQGKAAVMIKELKGEEEKEETQVKGRRSSSCSPLTAKERKFSRSCSWGNRPLTRVKDRVRRHSFSSETEARQPSFSTLKEARRARFSVDKSGRRWSFSIEQEDLIVAPEISKGLKQGKECSQKPEQAMQDAGIEECRNRDESQLPNGAMEATEAEKFQTEGTEDRGEKEEERDSQSGKKKGELPDCLLMMMYEPKLSMEVSKETWVCSTDFLHRRSHQSHRHRHLPKGGRSDNVGGGGDHLGSIATDVSTPKNPACQQPPAPPPPAPPPPHPPVPPTVATIEQKLKIELPLTAAAIPYAPLVLKRCKSEPMRSSARLAPGACFWKERHRPIGAAGISF